jgi:Ras-related GTP-binding protein A/B
MKQDGFRIPGTSWYIKISSPKNAPKNVMLEFIKGTHIEYEFIIQKDGSIEHILENFIATENLSIPRNRLEILIHKLNEELFDLDNIESDEQKVLDSMIKLSDVNDKKILILGLEEAGKTSIYEVIFEGKQWWEVKNLYPTRGIQRHKQGSRLYIWDLGGQRSYLKEYHKKAEEIFSSTTALIYVVDGADPESFKRSREEFEWALEKVKEFSPNAFIHCLIHKMDKFSNPKDTFDGIKVYFKDNLKTDDDINYVPTSIMDDSIYSAIKDLFKLIIPKSKKLDILAQNLKEQTGVYNVVVLEKRTGLPICASSTLFDDITLIGTFNKIWMNTSKLTQDLELVGMSKITVQCGNGYLYTEEIEKNIMLLIISPDLITIENTQNQEKINDFKKEMINFI